MAHKNSTERNMRDGNDGSGSVQLTAYTGAAPETRRQTGYSPLSTTLQDSCTVGTSNSETPGDP